ncbi:MAG: transposase [Acidimicrobiaceae bacterium]|nr:transposase [Acidimicrobiaceae bacterium]
MYVAIAYPMHHLLYASGRDYGAVGAAPAWSVGRADLGLRPGDRRLLASMGVACQVIAPSMIPKAPGDKVKTDSRDCRRLARLHRAGQLRLFLCATPP